MRRPNFYSGVALDRADRLRGEDTWLAARLSDPATWIVPVWRAHNFVTESQQVEAVFATGTTAIDLIAQARTAIFLGLHEKRTLVAVDLSEAEDPLEHPALSGRGRFEDLRAVGPLLERSQGALLAYARGLVHWHSRHQFCGVCGGPTESAQGGHIRRCLTASCGTSHFPRTDPAVIMLVHDGGDRCVMGRQRIWPPGMHSTLAGFVEPGESLEEAVAREVFEEVGIAVSRVTYHSSQPWPFPSSIMLGFHARADFTDLKVNLDELESARWFTRRELAASPEDERLKLPRRDSIARRLIEDWLSEAPAG